MQDTLSDFSLGLLMFSAVTFIAYAYAVIIAAIPVPL